MRAAIAPKRTRIIRRKRYGRAITLSVGPDFAMATAGRYTLLGCKLPGGGIYSGISPFRLISGEIT
jgi:hypothetical protein